jgi:hypothetical protein
MDYLNPDGLAYISIARSYAETGPAVRGYWSPLISWMSAAGMALGLDPQVAFKAVCGAAALAWIAAVDLLTATAALRPTGRLAVVTMVAFTGVTFAYSRGFLGAADVLGAAALAVYFTLLIRATTSSRPALTGVLLGGFGALAYYAKYFNFPFVLTHLVLVGALGWIHGHRDRSARVAMIAAVGTFIVLVTPWVIALRNRYGDLTISTAGPINHALAGDPNHPTYFGRLCPVPADVLFPFQDPPAQCYPEYGWGALDSPAALARQIQLASASFSGWARSTILFWGPWGPLALAATAAVGLAQWRNRHRRLTSLLLLGTLILNLSGYLIMGFSEPRFYLGVLPLLWIALFDHIPKVADRALAFAGARSRLSGTVLAAGAFLLPFMTFGRLSSMQYLLEEQHDACIREDAASLATVLAAPFAGTEPLVSHIAYYTRRQTYGALPATTDPLRLAEEVHDQGIRMVILHVDEPLADALIDSHRFTLVTTATICGDHFAVLRSPSEGPTAGGPLSGPS